MSSFSARLRMPGRSRLPLGVEVDISHDRITLTAGDRMVAGWSLGEIEVVTLSDGFHIKVDGEEIVLDVADPTRFATELGVGEERPSRLAAVGADQPNPNGFSTAHRPQDAVPKGRETAISPPPATETTSGEELLDEMTRRISEIAKALTSDSVSPAAAFAQWLTLLKEINRRHGQGSMPTDLYYRLNTQLLDLIPVPTPLPS
jgi:hypothetical protein